MNAKFSSIKLIREYKGYLANFAKSVGKGKRMSFKITDVLFSGDSTNADFRSDFQYNVEQWRKNSQYPKLSKSKLKSQKDKIMPDQRDQPYRPRPKPAPKNENKIDTNSVFQNAPQINKQENSKSEIPSTISKDISDLTLATERQIEFISVPNKSWTITGKKASDLYQASDQKFNPIFRLFDTEQKIRSLDETMKLKKKQQDDFRKQKPPQTKFIVPQIKSDTKAKSHSSGPSLITDDFYYNSLAERGDWSVIWDLNKISTIPLLFDKSDKYIASSRDTGSNQPLREWNTLDLLDSKRQFYSNMITQNQNNIEMALTNSDVANSLVLIEPNITDFEHFHHPAYKVSIDEPITVTHIPMKESKDESPHLNDLKSLSAKHGDVFLIEYTVENPAFILNIGMVTLLITYFRKQNDDDIPYSAGKLTNLKILEPNDASPFGAQLPPTPIQVLYCQLYRMPVCQHDWNKQDFLLVKDTDRNVFYIRPFQSVFCGGLIEPQVEVITPSSKKAQELQEKFMRAFLINIFRDIPNSPARQQLQVNQIQKSYFPDVNEQRLRKILKEYAEFNRNSGIGYWRVKLDNTQLNSAFQKLSIGPEEVCNLQSMIVGKWKLRKNGVNILYTPPKNMQIQKLKGVYTKKVAEKIEVELMKAPWTKTSNFKLAFKNRAVEMDQENGETIYRKKSRRQKSGNADAQANKRKLAGTSADLRGLTLVQIDEILHNEGVPPSRFHGLSRWKKVKLVEQLATRQKQDNYQTDLANSYARGPRNDYQASIEKYKQQYQQTFDNNLNFISIKKEDDDEADDDFDDGDLLESFGLDLNHNQMDEEEEELDPSPAEQTKKSQTQFQSTGDPPELTPNSIYTSPTQIDWSKYGFDPESTPMRDVVKLIHTSFSPETGVQVHVDWKRSPHEISELKKKPLVFQETGPPPNFENSILFERKKQIQEKLRKKKPKSKLANKQAGTSSLGYIPSHTFLLVQEDGNGQFRFNLTPDVLNQIKKARKKYKEYCNSNNSGRPVHTPKPFNDVQSNHQSEEQPKTQKKSIMRQLNDEFKRIIEDKGRSDYMNFYALRDPIDGVLPPNLMDFSNNCTNKRYISSRSFMNDIERIRSFYRDKEEGKNADDLYKTFAAAIETNRKIRKLEETIKKAAKKSE